ncbi:uncharacterized protein A1O5_10442 [Cladophialophora psammophila CBS 110553]|uniref:Major facilitator superfamily (MFS) profile domain-containing protein n=1 Tax=Cladophialophora psammophila CBS 110553 TaxID=1182543 RepID=W9WMP6_9EURO|nr:uncharacterized protein A1O5_10442 [Cladophialophora psammophila CBS 110553]EXJ66290.1 hypothetical protein A1O5_10442 [Cladophialophora psammophila CBS 110553]
MNGIYQTGGVIGSLLLPWVADKWGRKWSLAIPAILILISGAVMTGSMHVAEFIVFRFFAGAGTWMAAAASPLMMSELVPANLRGGLVELHGTYFQSGYTFAWVGFGCFFWANSSGAWRVPVAIQCLWPLLFLSGLYFCPESPRWLVMQGRDDEAKRVLEKIHTRSSKGRNLADAELLQIQRQVMIDRELDSSWVQLFKKPSYRKRAFLGIGTTGIVQFAGVLVINNYGPVIYGLLGYDEQKRLLYPAIWVTFGLGLFFVALFLVDLFPRNRLLAFGMFGCTATLAVEAALIANFVYQVFYAICVDGVQFAYLGEIFPTHLRAKGVCLGIATMSLMNIIWLQSAPTALKNIEWKIFLIFIILSAFGGVLFLVFWPDTRNMPLEETSALFGDKDEVAVYQNELEIDPTTHIAHDRQGPTTIKSDRAKSVERSESVHVDKA